MSSPELSTHAHVAPAGRFYRPELDVLRFCAFGFVFLAHALPHPPSLPPSLQNLCAGLAEGFGFGVDVFFLLSSYLITELLLREHRRTGRIDVPAFWVRRILRIWPLYFAFLGAAIWVIPMLLPQDFPTFHRIGYALFWGNFALILDAEVNTVAGILWSVSIEEQFYLVWPLVLSRYIGRLKKVVIGLIILSWATRIFLAATGSDGLWTFWANTPARMDPIGVGALVAVLLKGRTPAFSTAQRIGLLFAGFSTMLTAGLVFPRTGWLALVTYPLGTIAALLFLLGILGAPWRMPDWIVYLGKISFGLYVFHVLALRLSGEYVDLDVPTPVLSVVRFACSLGLTLVLAKISYSWLETPFLRLKDRFARVQH